MSSKKIFILTNMAPSPEKPSSGIFVTNQYEYLKRHDKNNSYEMMGMYRQFTKLLGSVKKYIAYARKVIKHLKQNRYDIIHVHYYFPLLPLTYFYARKKGTKTVVTIHGSDFYEKMENKLFKVIYTFFLKKSDYIISVGEEMKVDFEKALKVPVSEVLSAGVDDDVFFPVKTEKLYDFLYVGSLIDRKGFDVVLKVMEESIQLGCRWCVVGLGLKKYEAELERIKQSHPDFLTYIPALKQTELNLVNNQSKWFFFPSRNEPFGLVASEALFSGTPVICTPSGGLKEQVFENVNGFLINDVDDYNSIIQLVRKAYSMTDEEYNKLRENCNSSNSKFSLRYVCNRLVEIYNSL